jgi:murein L,D-transpeptidase YcbB/YkuD
VTTWFKIFHNKRLAKKLGWRPQWFGASDFNSDLIKKIKEFQSSWGLSQTGICNKITHRLILLKVLEDIQAKKAGKNVKF